MNKGLKIAHINIRSLFGKIEEIRFMLQKLNFDVLCINETWLNASINNNIISVDGYDLIRHDRMDGRRGGGVCIYIKNVIQYSDRKDLIDNNLEALWIELSPSKSRKLLIGSLYRPPDASSEYFEAIIDVLEKNKK